MGINGGDSKSRTEKGLRVPHFEVKERLALYEVIER